MQCINIKHPEYLALQQELGIHPDLLKAKISLWMGKNTDERFPTIEELGLSNSDMLYQVENSAQARIRILKSLQANKDGFVKPIKYAALLKEVGDHNKVFGAGSIQLRKAANGNYYLVTKGTTLSQKSSSSTARNRDLENKLYQWATTHGISIEALDVLLEKFAGRYENGILGVADFAKGLIGIADDAKLDTLPEEIAHFAIELMASNPAVIRALETVHLTPEYSLVEEEYKDVYTTEEQFRKETLGKLLAAELINQFTNTTLSREASTTQEEKTFWTYLGSLK